VRDSRVRPAPASPPATAQDATADGGSGDGGSGLADADLAGVGFRTYGKSKDSRDDLPQIVIGMAVTRDGNPVRVWCWPGNTND
jgi:transposase